MPSRRLPLCCVLLSLGFACDEPTSSPASDPAPDREQAVADASEPEAAAEAGEAGDDRAASEVDEPSEPAPPAGGPSCDQRALAVDGGEPRRLCVDFTEHRGEAEPRCFEGVELSEGPCPAEGVVAVCKLRATGVSMRYYDGVDVDAARRDCQAIRGDWSAEAQR